MKLLFKAAHYTFATEIPHTTHWRGLVSTIASCDLSGRLAKFLRNCPANAHHLSTTTVTSILDAFGYTVQASLRDRVANLTEFSLMADECTDANGVEQLSLCVRFLEGEAPGAIVEMFLGCWSVQSTKADDIHQCIVNKVAQFGLTPDRLVSAAFDGASNMSGQRGGVQALLKQAAPTLVFVHCRSHLLQLALVRASNTVVEMKQVLSSLTSLYTLFSRSPVRLNILKQTEDAIDGMSHKLIQPGSARWLSYEGSVTVVLKHYAAICLALEAIYVAAGDLSSTAGGLLLTLRKPSTLLFLLVLQHFLQPLARLSKCLQSSNSNIAEAMTTAQAITAALRDEFKYDDIVAEFERRRDAAAASGVAFSGEDMTAAKTEAVSVKFHKTVVTNLESRFSDDVSSLCQVQAILCSKQQPADFSTVARILSVSATDLQSEWKILSRLPGDLDTTSSMLNLALSADKVAMFPAFSTAVRKLLLLPVGTATVERSFSTMNRILCSRRCRLLPDHVCQLMQLSIEGPEVPDVRDGTDEQEMTLNSFVDKSYKKWLEQPRRGLQ